MRVRTDVLLVAILAGSAVMGVWINSIASQQGDVQDTRTSTLVPGPDGSQAAYETMAELGVPVKRRRTALFTLGDELSQPAVLAVVAPRGELMTDELTEVVHYVQHGGAVVAVGDGGGIAPCAGFEAARGDSGTVSDGFFSMGKAYKVVPPRGQHLPATRRVLRPWQPPKELARAARQQHDAAGCNGLVPASQDTLLRTLDGRAVVLDLRYAPRGGASGGRVVLVADPGYFRNRTWRETDAPLLVVPLLVPSRKGPLVWDEYHQGFEQESGAMAAYWAWLRGTPAGWALLQLTAVLLVWLAVKAVRFGPALAVVERRRRSPLEHVEALAAGLEGARGSRTAVELIVAGLRRRLSRTGQITGGNVSGWLETLELVMRSDRGRTAARELRRLWQTTGGAERVLATAQAVEDVWQDLRPRSSPAAS